MLSPSHSSIYRRRFAIENISSFSGSAVPSTEKTPVKAISNQFPCALSPACHTRASPSFAHELISLQGSINFDHSPEPESSKFEEALQFLFLRDIGCSRKQAIEYTSRNIKNKQVLLSRLPKDIRSQFKKNLKKTKSKPYNFMSDDKNFETVSKALNDIIEQKEAKIDVNAQKIRTRKHGNFLPRNKSEANLFNNDAHAYSPRVVGKNSSRLLNNHISNKIMNNNTSEGTDYNFLPEISPKSNRFQKFIYGKTFQTGNCSDKPNLISSPLIKSSFCNLEELSDEESSHQIINEEKLATKIKSEKLIKNRIKGKKDEQNLFLKKELKKKPIEHNRKQSQDIKLKAIMAKGVH